MTAADRIPARARRKLLCLAIGLPALFAVPGAARACTDGNSIRYYFSARPPHAEGTQLVLRAHVLAADEAGATVRFEESHAGILQGETARIEYSEYPGGTNCVDIGSTDGLVYLIARTLIRYEKAGISIVAVPAKSRGSAAGRELEQLRRKATIYIDPSFMGSKR